jgi:hypothetical protein
MLSRNRNRFIVLGAVVLLSSSLGATSGMAASKPSPPAAPAAQAGRVAFTLSKAAITLWLLGE